MSMCMCAYALFTHFKSSESSVRHKSMYFVSWKHYFRSKCLYCTNLMGHVPRAMQLKRLCFSKMSKAIIFSWPLKTPSHGIRQLREPCTPCLYCSKALDWLYSGWIMHRNSSTHSLTLIRALMMLSLLPSQKLKLFNKYTEISNMPLFRGARIQ